MLGSRAPPLRGPARTTSSAEEIAQSRRTPGGQRALKPLKLEATTNKRVAAPKGRGPMSDSFPVKIMIVAMLLSPVAALAQSGGGAGGGSAGGSSAGGAASGPSAGTSSAAGSPNAGSAGTAAVSGVPSGPANAGGLNNSGNDPSGAGQAAKVPTAPGTNSLGTANSSGSTSGTAGSNTTGMAKTRAGAGNGGRIDGTVTPGPSMPGDAEIRAEDPKVDAKIKSICKGC
jgi:hypothetical protein